MYPYKKFQRSSKKIHVLSTRANRVKTYSIDQWKEKLQNQLEGVKPKISGLKRGTQVLLLATRRSTRWEINCRTRSKKANRSMKSSTSSTAWSWSSDQCVRAPARLLSAAAIQLEVMEIAGP